MTDRTRWSVALGEHLFLEPDDIILGRASGCAVRITGDGKVSRRHCRVVLRPPKVFVHDLGSHNGTVVNGVEVPPGEWELRDGDELRLGDTVLRVVVREQPVPGLHLVRELGRGAQGVVHLARETGSGDLVAVKILAAAADPDARETFRRELDCTRALRHPNIVRFRRSYPDPFCFTAEFCPDGSVADLVLRRGPLPPVAAVALVRQALDALAYAHQAQIPVRLAGGGTATGRGLVHRDLKPPNLLLAGGVLKIADFGLAKAFDQAGLSGRTPTGAIGGSVAFLPRRQLIDYKYAGPDVDLWAITACLYWMLTGATPRDFPPGADPVAVVLREPVVAVRERVPALPPRLAAVIDETLADSPAAPATAAALAEALRHLD